MKKQTEKKEYQYPYPILNKFADMINHEYKGDYYKFLKDKKALTDDNKVIEYKDTTGYYETHIKGFDDTDDFFRPSIVMAFWDRLYKQALNIMITKIEEEYVQELSISGVDLRLKKLNEIRETLTNLNILKC